MQKHVWTDYGYDDQGYPQMQCSACKTIVLCELLDQIDLECHGE